MRYSENVNKHYPRLDALKIGVFLQRKEVFKRGLRNLTIDGFLCAESFRFDNVSLLIKG